MPVPCKQRETRRRLPSRTHSVSVEARGMRANTGQPTRRRGSKALNDQDSAARAPRAPDHAAAGGKDRRLRIERDTCGPVSGASPFPGKFPVVLEA